MRTSKIILLVSLLALAVILVAACSTPAQPTTSPNQPTTSSVQPVIGDGQALLQERCTACHTLDRVQTAKKTSDQWDQTVTRMIGKGSRLSDAEKKTLVTFLSATYKP